MTDTLVGRLREKRGIFDNRWPGPSELELEAAAEIERLTRELQYAERRYLTHNPYAEHNKVLEARALAAESSLSEAVKALEPFAKAYDEPHCEALGLVTITVKQKDLRRASAIRSRAAVLDSERGSTHEA